MAKKSEKEDPSRPMDPETEKKKKLRALAFSKKLLRRAPSNSSTSLEPSKTLLKHQGKDVIKKGQRKSRYLFSFPGLLAPVSGGKVGELADLGTKNPILYLEFPQGRMKLFGTHVYPKNKYLTLQFSRSSKGVMCEDSFESMIVFADAWWIGLKEENPEELQLEFPKDLNESKHADFDFKGGAGATFGEKSGGNKPGKEVEPLSPDTELQDDASEDSYPSTGKNMKNEMEATPIRQSARRSGKALNYAEPSSGDDSIASDADISEMLEEKVGVRSDDATRNSVLEKTEDPTPAISNHASESEFTDSKIQSTGKIERISLSVKKSKEVPPNKKGTLVQATLSTLFEKAAEKKSKRSATDSPGPGTGGKRQRLSSKQLTNQEQLKGFNKKEASFGGKNAGTRAVSLQKQSQVQDDDTEDISSESQDADGSDEDWGA